LDRSDFREEEARGIDGVGRGRARGLLQVPLRATISGLMGMAHMPSCRRFSDILFARPYEPAYISFEWLWRASWASRGMGTATFDMIVFV